MCTSIDAGRSETGMVAQGFGHLQNLVSQLSGWAQYNRPGSLGLALLPTLLLLLQLVHLQRQNIVMPLTQNGEACKAGLPYSGSPFEVGCSLQCKVLLGRPL